MSWISKKFSAVALDPIHIGTGGERLGRVDLSVVREPATKVPKIPGTTLSGAIKFFLDLALRDQVGKDTICASTEGSKLNHAWHKCPVCFSFGYTPQQSNEEDNQPPVDPASAQGIIQFTDATLLAFPVPTVTGPVWITTKPRLKNLLGLGDGIDNCGENWLCPNGTKVVPLNGEKINLGQIVLDKGGAAIPGVSEFVAAGINEIYASRFIPVSEWIFSHLVNSNMETRTSVVIDPKTGAAAGQGLFTYEAVVRGSIFVFEMIENDYQQGWPEVDWDNDSAPKPDSSMEMLEKYALNGVKTVGLGGMTTRGFGRLECSPLNESVEETA